MDARTLKGIGAILVFVGGMFLSGCSQAHIQLEDSTYIEIEDGGQISSISNSADEGFSSEPGAGKAISMLADDIWSLPGLVIEDSKDIVTTDNNLLWLLAAGGGSIALRNSGADRRIADNFDDHPWVSSNGDWDKFVYYAGGPAVHFSATGVWYLASAAKGDERNRRNAWTMFEALSVNGAATVALKLIVNDETPNEKDWAWPSGHTSSSFTVAAVLDEFYGPKVGIPAYIGAGFVGYRMMDAGDHWASDVLFGAVLGYMVGHHVAGRDKNLEIAGFHLVPYNDVVADKPVTGLGFYKKF